MQLRPRLGWLIRVGAAGLLLMGCVALLSSSATPPFTPNEKAFYADETTLSFVRPGLVFKIQKVDIAADGTLKVVFSMTDKVGVGLDRTGILSPGPVSSSFVLSYIPKDKTAYVPLTVRNAASTNGNGVTKAQGTSDTNSGVASAYKQVSEGVYEFTLAYKLQAGYDRTATYTVAVYGNRNLSEFDMGTNFADAWFNFVPDGSAVTNVRNIIETKTCNKCHDGLGAHGGSRRSVEVCNLCHAPGYTDDPESLNVGNFPVMIHRIHYGRELPSVKAGNKYVWIGYQNRAIDFSDIGFPATELASGAVPCQSCHEKGPKQADNWLTNPNRAACGACHDNVNFATGEGHFGLPQPTDNMCKTCHIPEGELDFDASIKGAHTTDSESRMITGVVMKVVGITNTAAGQKPVITFNIKDRAGAPIKIEDMNRVAFLLTGPATDFVLPGPSGYVQETVTAAQVTASGANYVYTMSNAVPADAKGTWAIGSEARRYETVLQGTLKEKRIETGSPNEMFYFSADGSPVAKRRLVVARDKCNACHYDLSLHGTNRNATEYCVACHNPVQNDRSRRAADLMPAESIDFALMVHRIHSGARQIRDYTIYGFGNTPHNYNKVQLPTPASLANCSLCHLNNTWNIPLPKTNADKQDVRGLLYPVKPASGACLACHTSTDAAAHALINTSDRLGESCGVCHGATSDYAVTKVHAR